MNQKYRFKAQINLFDFLFRDLIFAFLLFLGSTLRDLTIEDDDMIDFLVINFLR